MPGRALTYFAIMRTMNEQMPQNFIIAEIMPGRDDDDDDEYEDEDDDRKGSNNYVFKWLYSRRRLSQKGRQRSSLLVWGRNCFY